MVLITLDALCGHRRTNAPQAVTISCSMCGFIVSDSVSTLQYLLDTSPLTACVPAKTSGVRTKTRMA